MAAPSGKVAAPDALAATVLVAVLITNTSFMALFATQAYARFAVTAALQPLLSTASAPGGGNPAIR